METASEKEALTMWGYYCWYHANWFKTTKGARWHRKRWDCDDNVERVSKRVSRRLQGLTRDQVNQFEP